MNTEARVIKINGWSVEPIKDLENKTQHILIGSPTLVLPYVFVHIKSVTAACDRLFGEVVRVNEPMPWAAELAKAALPVAGDDVVIELGDPLSRKHVKRLQKIQVQLRLQEI